jgi:hypothetical protein
MSPVLTAVAVLVLLALLLPTRLFTRDRSRVCACCRSRPEVTRIVAGPGLGICESCVRAATNLIKTPGPLWRLPCCVPAKERRPPNRCSFCGKDRDNVDGLVILSAGAICSECINLCGEIFAAAPNAAT